MKNELLKLYTIDSVACIYSNINCGLSSCDDDTIIKYLYAVNNLVNFKVSEKAYLKLQDENYHSLNIALCFLGKFGKKELNNITGFLKPHNYEYFKNILRVRNEQNGVFSAKSERLEKLKSNYTILN